MGGYLHSFIDRPFLAAALFPFYAFIQMNFLNTLSTQLVQNAAITHSQLGVLSASYIYADALLLLPAGILLDRFPLRNLLLTGVLLCTVGALLFAISQTFAFILSSRIISGAGHAFALLGCFQLIGLNFEPRQQGFLIGLVLTIALLGGFAAQAPLALLIEKTNWQFALWLNVSLGVLIVFALWKSISNEPLRNKTCSFSHLKAHLKLTCKNVQNWYAGLYTCLLGLPLMLLGAIWGSTYLSSAKNLSFLEASCVSSSIFLGTIIGSPLVGWMSDKLSQRKPAMIIGALLSLLLLIAIINLNHLSVIGYVGLFFLLSICASTQILGYSVVLENNAVAYQSTAMGFVNTLIMSGTATFQVAFGWAWGHPALKTYAIGILLIALIASVILAFGIKEGSLLRAS